MGGRDPCLPVGDAPPSSLQIQVCLVLEQCAPTSLFQRLSGPAGRDRVGHVARVLPALSHVTRLTRLSRERTVRTAVQRLGRRWPILLPGRVTMAASGFFAFARGLQFFYFRARSTPARAHTSWSSGIRHRASANRISGYLRAISAHGWLRVTAGATPQTRRAAGRRRARPLRAPYNAI